MKKKITISILTIISLFSLIYYSSKFYKYIKVEDCSILYFTLLFVIILTLGLGIFNAYSTVKLKRQNEELLNIVYELSEKLDLNCGKVLEATFNSRDIELDIYNKIKEGG